MQYDYLIVGAGISGAAAGYELALHGKVAIVEAESHAGYHSTGRSAALYTPNYGPDLVRSISQLSFPFLKEPPNGFTDQTLLSPRGMLTVLPADAELLQKIVFDTVGEHFTELTQQQTLDKAPFLRPDRVGGAIYEEGVLDMDVGSLHQGFLRGFKQRGGTLLNNSRIESIVRKTSHWEISANNGQYNGRVIVNAAGAWADEVAAMVRATTIGLVPKRRTAILIEMPSSVGNRLVPAMDFHGVDNYMKAESGKLMVSPGDETPVAAQDIQPDEMDIAVLVEWLEQETTIKVARIGHSWAGLRSFVADGAPVVGYDERIEDFFWLAGQGGYGIMMAAALARASASLLIGNQLPKDFIEIGIDKEQLSAKRFNV